MQRFRDSLNESKMLNHHKLDADVEADFNNLFRTMEPTSKSKFWNCGPWSPRSSMFVIINLNLQSAVEFVITTAVVFTTWRSVSGSTFRTRAHHFVRRYQENARWKYKPHRSVKNNKKKKNIKLLNDQAAAAVINTSTTSEWGRMLQFIYLSLIIDLYKIKNLLPKLTYLSLTNL